MSHDLSLNNVANGRCSVPRDRVSPQEPEAVRLKLASPDPSFGQFEDICIRANMYAHLQLIVPRIDARPELDVYPPQNFMSSSTMKMNDLIKAFDCSHRCSSRSQTQNDADTFVPRHYPSETVLCRSTLDKICGTACSIRSTPQYRSMLRRVILCC